MQVRTRNLALVAATLEEAKVPYFCLPRGGYTSAVAVPVRYRPKVMKALRSGLPASVTVRPGRTKRRSSSITENMDIAPTQANVLVYQTVTSGQSGWMLGQKFGCLIEFWVDGPNGFLIGAAPDRPGNMVLASDPEVLVPESKLSALVPHAGAMMVRTRSGFARPQDTDITFPIDAVFTWVDGADTDWQHRKNTALAAAGQATLNIAAANNSRFASRDELRYAMRSVVCNAPWIRHIFLVTDDQAPPWLHLDHPMVTLVSHRDIFGDVGALPTFNSHAIESRLHHIPGLAEHFLYLNDDMFFGRPLAPDKFFHGNGMTKFFRSTAVLDPAPPAVTDLPATAAGKNNRRIVEEHFGFSITHKMRHVPYALRRSVLFEIEEACREELHATASHQFRHPGDLSLTSSLAHYWAYATERAVPSRVSYSYVDLGASNAARRLSSLLTSRSSDIFCLNDTDDDPTEEDIRRIQHYLDAYFPYRAPFELSDAETSLRSSLTASQLVQASRRLPRQRTRPEILHADLVAGGSSGDLVASDLVSGELGKASAKCLPVVSSADHGPAFGFDAGHQLISIAG